MKQRPRRTLLAEPLSRHQASIADSINQDRSVLGEDL